MVRALVWIMLIAWFCVALTHIALARNNGQYAQAPDPWWSQQLDQKGKSCCSYSDGIYAEEDQRDNHYWARWMVNGGMTAWIQVPDHTVISGRSPNGGPVVWWIKDSDDGAITITCFIPGAKV